VPAKVRRCFKSRTLTRVLPVGPGSAWTLAPYDVVAGGGVSFQQGSWDGVCVSTGGAGHQCTHERSDGMNPSR
jgi:hypothetical protein